MDPATVAWRPLRDMPDRPTALIVQSDHLAAWLMQCMQADGTRIPEDMAVLATAASMWSGLTNPPVTTVCVPAEEYGKAVGETLMSRLKNPSAAPVQV